MVTGARGSIERVAGWCASVLERADPPVLSRDIEARIEGTHAIRHGVGRFWSASLLLNLPTPARWRSGGSGGTPDLASLWVVRCDHFKSGLAERERARLELKCAL